MRMLWIPQGQYDQVRLMKTKLLFLTLLCAGNLWAGRIEEDILFLEKVSQIPQLSDTSRDSVNKEITRLRTKVQEEYLDKKVGDSVQNSTLTWSPSWILDWTVNRGSQTYTLDKFVGSGMFCKERGKHEWADAWKSACRGASQECSLCGHCRQKIKVNKTVEEWEN